MLDKSLFKFWAGIFVILTLSALVFLTFTVSGLTNYSKSDYYTVTAEFDNIGSLKVRSPILISGVKIGQVSDIVLDSKTFRALVYMKINENQSNLPEDSSASILTQGLLGSNYISISPGFDNQYMKNGSVIESTHSAMILENLVGQFLFSLKSSDKEKESSK